jgi:hypothetical protein
MAQIVSKWDDRRLRVGWTIRLRNGKLAVITWMSPRGDGWACYTAKPISGEG